MIKTKKPETKIIRIHENEYRLLEKIIDKLKVQWGRNATFADAVRYMANISKTD